MDFKDKLARAERALGNAEVNAKAVIAKIHLAPPETRELAPDVQANAALTYIMQARDLYRQAFEAKEG